MYRYSRGSSLRSIQPLCKTTPCLLCATAVQPRVAREACTVPKTVVRDDARKTRNARLRMMVLPQ